jgi:FkbM family methyltransferase
LYRKNTSDLRVARQIFVDNDYNLPFSIKNSKIIIDAGANNGYSTLWFSNLASKAKVFAIEPESSNFNLLKKNTKYNSNIIPIKAGLWSSKEYLKIYDPGFGKWGIEVKKATKNNYDLLGISINDLIKEYNLKKIDVLKIDIEGSELEVFSNNLSWLSKVDVIIIELHDYMFDDCSKVFYNAVNKYKWKKHISGENVILVRI